MPALVRRGIRPLLVLALAVGTLAGCWPSVGTDFADPGPYETSVQTDAEHTYFFPTELGPGGRSHPVILWGNGTFTNPTHYEALLRHFASHGFIVAAANTSNAGSGVEMLAGLDNLEEFNEAAGNRFEGHVDVNHVATMGHSQGGSGAVRAGADPRIDTVVVLQGGGPVADLHSPTLFLSGSADTVVPPALLRQQYDAATHIPAAYGDLAGADHFQPIVNGNGYRGPVTAWVRWRLMGDKIAGNQYVGDCAYCADPIWATYEANPLLEAMAPRDD